MMEFPISTLRLTSQSNFSKSAFRFASTALPFSMQLHGGVGTWGGEVKVVLKNESIQSRRATL